MAFFDLFKKKKSDNSSNSSSTVRKTEERQKETVEKPASSVVTRQLTRKEKKFISNKLTFAAVSNRRAEVEALVLNELHCGNAKPDMLWKALLNFKMQNLPNLSRFVAVTMKGGPEHVSEANLVIEDILLSYMVVLIENTKSGKDARISTEFVCDEIIKIANKERVCSRKVFLAEEDILRGVLSIPRKVKKVKPLTEYVKSATLHASTIIAKYQEAIKQFIRDTRVKAAMEGVVIEEEFERVTGEVVNSIIKADFTGTPEELEKEVIRLLNEKIIESAECSSDEIQRASIDFGEAISSSIIDITQEVVVEDYEIEDIIECNRVWINVDNEYLLDGETVTLLTVTTVEEEAENPELDIDIPEPKYFYYFLAVLSCWYKLNPNFKLTESAIGAATYVAFNTDITDEFNYLAFVGEAGAGEIMESSLGVPTIHSTTTLENIQKMAQLVKPESAELTGPKTESVVIDAPHSEDFRYPEVTGFDVHVMNEECKALYITQTGTEHMSYSAVNVMIQSKEELEYVAEVMRQRIEKEDLEVVELEFLESTLREYRKSLKGTEMSSELGSNNEEIMNLPNEQSTHIVDETLENLNKMGTSTIFSSHYEMPEDLVDQLANSLRISSVADKEDCYRGIHFEPSKESFTLPGDVWVSVEFARDGSLVVCLTQDKEDGERRKLPVVHITGEEILQFVSNHFRKGIEDGSLDEITQQDLDNVVELWSV